MKIKLLIPCVAALAISLASVKPASAQTDPAAAARIAALEHGPASVNVSSYPQGIQDDYEVFTQKCTQCHKLSVPINSAYVTPEEWSNYVKLMMHKIGSNIGGDDGKKIYEFLVYDSSVRKKAQLQAKLATLSPAQKADAEAKIKAVHDKYGN